MATKLTMDQMVEQIDAAKKVNPLDLSSDQDLTIAIMNLVSLEEHFFFSGAKTGKHGFYELINSVRDMRKDLMERIVHKNTSEHGEVWCISKHLLAASMRLMEVGTKANAAGRTDNAADFFGKAYDMYSLFWGINMDLIDVSNVKHISPDVYTMAANDQEKQDAKHAQAAASTPQPQVKSKIKSLGAWVREKVNCCIE